MALSPPGEPHDQNSHRLGTGTRFVSRSCAPLYGDSARGTRESETELQHSVFGGDTTCIGNFGNEEKLVGFATMKERKKVL